MPEDATNVLCTELGTIKRMALRWSREPGTRLQVVGIWMFVVLLAAVTGSEVGRRLFEIVSAASLAFFVWPFVQGPYLLYTRHWLPLRADYRIFEGELLAQFPAHRIEGLSRLGFEFAGHLVQYPGTRNVAVRLAMFIHPANKDSAGLAEVVSGLRTIAFLAFKSRFDDGFAFETSNSQTATVFERDPNFQVFQFPGLRSTTDLYRLHCKIKEQFALSHRATLADKNGEVAEFMARAEVVRQRHAHSGDYKLSAAGDRYLYTWRGAIRHAWLHGWPIKFFRTMRVQSKGMKKAQELGLRINPKFGRLEESLSPREVDVSRRQRL
jgi:hypothetical protein